MEDTKENFVKDNNTKSNSTKLERLRYVVFTLAFYIYVAGALYFYGLMDALGFKGASLDSVFSPLVYSQYFIVDIFSNAIMFQWLELLLLPILNSAIITGFVLVAALAIKFKLWKKVPDKLKKDLNKPTSWLKGKPVISALMTFPLVYFSHLVVIAIFVALLSFVTIPLIAPYTMGSIAAQKIVEQNDGNVCKEFDWDSEQYKSKSIVLSCERIQVNKSGDSVRGSVIHTDQKYLYALTNNLLFRIKDNQVTSCITKQHNVNKDSNIKAQEEKNEFKSCEDLYLLSRPKDKTD